MPMRSSRHPVRAVIAAVAWVIAVVATPSIAGAASTVKIAAAGDATPLGGVFAGPSFIGPPSAAGQGVVALRSRITGAVPREGIFLVTPISRIQVVTVGDPTPAGGVFRAFLGRPAVNARGQVAFFALFTGEEEETGLFVFSGGTIATVAVTGTPAPGDGTLGAFGAVGVSAGDPTITDTPFRGPALNERGDIAFVASLTDSEALGAIFLFSEGALSEVVRLDGRAGQASESFVGLGFPALTGAGDVVFRAEVADASGRVSTGLYRRGGDTVSAVVTDRTSLPVVGRFTHLPDAVGVNARGDIAFFAGRPPDAEDGGVKGLFLATAAGIRSVATPGMVLPGGGRLGTFVLPGEDEVFGPPAISPGGDVIFYATINGPALQGIFRVTPAGSLRLVARGDPTPLGGTVGTFGSGPAIDDDGAVTFRAFVNGGVAAEAVMTVTGATITRVIGVGEPSPGSGTFAGNAFGRPSIGGGGAVTFRAFIAGGSTNEAIFRFRPDTGLEVLGTVGATAPSGNPIIDLQGTPAINAAGDVVFAAEVAGEGLQLLRVRAGTLERVVRRGDPSPLGGIFTTIGVGAALNDAGVVAFRASADTGNGKRTGLFLTAPQLEQVALSGETAAAELAFAGFRDPVLSEVPSIAFRAPIVDPDDDQAVEHNGIFLGVPGTVRLLAGEGDVIDGDLRYGRLPGTPAVSADGDVAFLASRLRLVDEGGTLVPTDGGPAIFRASGGELHTVVEADTPSPIGGTFRTFGHPALARGSALAFRASLAGAARATGIFLRDGETTVPVVLAAQGTPIGGRFASFDIRPAMNADTHLAFLATVSRGFSVQGVFYATPTVLEAGELRVRGRPSRERLRAVLSFFPGVHTNGVDPTREPVVVQLADATGAVYTLSLKSGALRPRRGKTFVATRVRARLGSRPQRRSGNLNKLRLVRRLLPARVDVIVKGSKLDLTDGGTRPITPPLTVHVEIGDDAGSVNLRCDSAAALLDCR
jgi:hypothetical protein